MKVDIGPYVKDDSERKVEVRIDKYDVWNSDHTLALIILPILKAHREDQTGYPTIHESEVPGDMIDLDGEELWDTILDRMIFAFKHIVDCSWEEGLDYEQRAKIHKNIKEGTELFGKFYTDLWT